MILSFVIFLIILLGLGYGLSWIFKLKGSAVMVGFAVLPILVTLMGVFKIPLLWQAITALCTLLFLSIATQKLKFSVWFILALFLSFVIFGVYLYSESKMKYLEDDDPWDHAVGVSYITKEKTMYEPSYFDIHYLDPYPPSFDIILGLMNQIDHSVFWTLKFYNSIFCGLAILVFFILASELFKNQKKAFLGTMILALLPCFMSHFIWAQSLGVISVMVVFYCWLKSKEDPKWRIISILAVASVFVVQPMAVAVLLIFGALYLVIVDYRVLISFIPGILLAGVYWIPMFYRHGGIMSTFEKAGFGMGMITGIGQDTSGGVIYSISEFLFPPLATKMDQPIGVGIIVCIIAVISIGLMILNYKNISRINIFILASVIVSFLMVEGNALPVKVFPHRSWVFFAIFLALLCCTFLYFLGTMRWGVFWVSLVMIFVIFTSGYPKFVVETSNWPAGVKFTSVQELELYSVLLQLPKGTNVYQFGSIGQNQVIGLDKYSCAWCPEIYNYTNSTLNMNSSNISAFLKDNNYSYVVISANGYMCLMEKYGENATMNYLYSTIIPLTNYSVLYQNSAGVIIEVKK